MTAKKRKSRKKRKHRPSPKPQPQQEKLQQKPAPKPKIEPEPEAVSPERLLADLLPPEAEEDVEKSIADYLKALEEGTLDPDYSFDWLSDIRQKLGNERPEARARFAELVERLRHEAPDLYEDHCEYLARQLIGDAIADGRLDAIPGYLEPFVREPNLDMFYPIIDQLMYHGQTRVLLDVMKRMWPTVRHSTDILDWAVEEFGSDTMLVMLLDRLESAGDLSPDDPDFLKATAAYGEWAEGWLEEAIPRLLGRISTPWQPSDFKRKMSAKRWRDNVHLLTLELAGHLHHNGVPLSKAYMFRIQMADYLTWQPPAPTARSRRKSKVTASGGSLLIPRSKFMDEFLGNKLPFLAAKPYQAAVTVELIPAYLHFLTRLHLIRPEQMDSALEELRPVVAIAPAVLKSYGVDPVAIQNVTSAWSPEALNALREDQESTVSSESS